MLCNFSPFYRCQSSGTIVYILAQLFYFLNDGVHFNPSIEHVSWAVKEIFSNVTMLEKLKNICFIYCFHGTDIA